jgi:hypothetical protein
MQSYITVKNPSVFEYEDRKSVFIGMAMPVSTEADAIAFIDSVKKRYPDARHHVYAYVYSDQTAWSDTYCYFDATFVETAVGQDVELTLSAAAFDENFAPITVPVAGATLIVDGQTTPICTDDAGKAIISFAQAGSYLITADSAEMNLVDPVCIIQAQ